MPEDPMRYASRIAYSSKQTLMLTYEMAHKFKDSPSCFVEAGVAAGAQVIAMAAAAPKQTIFAFDSFQGIPLPSNKDDQMPGIRFLSKEEQNALPDPGQQKLETTGATSVSLDDFLDNLEEAGIVNHNIIAMKGWFEETVIDFPYDISLLRLDGDLYNSTFVCLQHLFPKVISGGCIIIDDWQLKGCRDACNEYFQFIDYEPNYIPTSNVVYFFK